MKLLGWKIRVITGFALCFVILACQKQATVQPQAERYPHEHLQTSALEPNAELHTVDYKLRNGETLADVAKLRYGHQHYASVVKLYNHFDDERQLAADSALRLPDISAILAEEGLTKVAAQEVALILCSRAKYDRATIPTQTVTTSIWSNSDTRSR